MKRIALITGGSRGTEGISLKKRLPKKINPSKEQLLKYLNGEEKIPDGLETELLSSYGLKRVLVHDVQTRYIHTPPEDEEEQ